MMKKIFIALILIFSINVANAQNAWKVDKAHSSITFSVSHFMISEVTGNFKSFDINAEANEKFEKPVFKVSINTASINTNQEGRDNHLKSPDFFNVKKNPTITFNSESFNDLKDGNFETNGTITINGIAKKISFNGKLNGIIKARSGKNKAGLKLTSTIKREDFNLGKGMSPIGKDVTVTINIEMNQQ
ncbi:YceI family protein [Tenacibaculum sp. nBUS_03]|uniref:YceI family protein n=1 Tax=Tenacibaculum sp. nBUS_03 TaxID=3395320 RepID=UPI003EC1288C